MLIIFPHQPSDPITSFIKTLDFKFGTHGQLFGPIMDLDLKTKHCWEF